MAVLEFGLAVLVPWLLERITDQAQSQDQRREIENALNSSLSDAFEAFHAAHPDLVDSFFDDKFVNTSVVREEIAALLTRNKSPDVEAIVRSYQAQFSRELPYDVTPAVEHFLSLIEESLKSRPVLQRHIDSRQIEQTHNLLKDTAESVQRTEEHTQAIRQSLSQNSPTKIVNQAIESETNNIRKSRFFGEFDTLGAALRLGERLLTGDLATGSDETRGRGLAWCARVLSVTDEVRRGEEFLKHAKQLIDSAELRIAEAFFRCGKEDRSAVFKALANLDSDPARTASLTIIGNQDGAEAALRWMSQAGYTADDLDSDGKSLFLNYQLREGDWNGAFNTVGQLSESDYANTPILLYFMALTKLASAIPEELRALILHQVPFDVANFPLASDARAMASREQALSYFIDAIPAAERRGCTVLARLCEEYALWMELRDPSRVVEGKSRLKNKLRDPRNSLSFVRYALQFGIELDLASVERDIEKSIAINGGLTFEAATARYAIAFTKPNPQQVADYIGRYRNQLSTYIDSSSMGYLQVEMLARAGSIEKANEILDQLLEQGIPAEQERNLRRVIAEAQGSDRTASRKAQYKDTGSLEDLINLVDTLEEGGNWEELCDFGLALFEKTNSLKDAVRLANALNKTGKFEQLVDFLEANTDLLSQSSYLGMAYAWGLFNRGSVLHSRRVLEKLHDLDNTQNYRTLRVNLGIATGDWASLVAQISDDFLNRKERSPTDLMRSAQLALAIGSPHAKPLLFEAVSKANDDPSAYVSAYFIASSAGWEDDPQVLTWMEKAANLSGENGPLQKISLQEILEKKPEWDRRASETWQSLSTGKLPLFVAAQLLNRTLIELKTLPALANLEQTDPRRRSVIPAFSGKRMALESEWDTSKQKAAMDATALLTLSFLGMLDIALDMFKNVYISHSTLEWLFEERQKATFHQPSRIADAHKVRDLLARGLLEKFSPTSLTSSSLASLVGEELAGLIAGAEAQADQEHEDGRCVVVRPGPVHRVASLMREVADLSPHSKVLSSCAAVVEKLREKGQITSDEKSRADSFLHLNEIPWPNQPLIADGATLYLDSLSISYLLHLGLLGKLKVAGLRALVSPSWFPEADALISYEHFSGEANAIIERIRASLNTRIESGHVKLGPKPKFDEEGSKGLPAHPTAGIMGMVSECDVLVVDDRMINQHTELKDRDKTARVLTTIDLLDGLMSVGSISKDDCLGSRTRLRQAGYFAVPITENELYGYLKESTVKNGALIETAELKAIRESILLARMGNWLQLPGEANWLNTIFQVYVAVLKNLWRAEEDLTETTARSDWLLSQLDIRGWAHAFNPDHANYIVRLGRGSHILTLLTPPERVTENVLNNYWHWVEESLLATVHEQFPDLYAWLVDWHRNQISELIESNPLEEN